MTRKAAAKPVPEAFDTVREINRRAGHEIRNALNGVAVNVEVVRARTRPGSSSPEVASFAERAAAQVGEASALADGLLALLGAVFTAAADGSLRGRASGGASEIELKVYGDRADRLMSDIGHLASRIGVGVERSGEMVILRVSPGS